MAIAKDVVEEQKDASYDGFPYRGWAVQRKLEVVKGQW